MFGNALLRFAHQLGEWNCWFAFWGLGIGVWSGVVWRYSSAYDRHVQRQAARAERFCRECRWAMPEANRLTKDADVDWLNARCMHPSSRMYPERFLAAGGDRFEDMTMCPPRP